MKGVEDISNRLSGISGFSSLDRHGSDTETFELDGLCPQWAVFPKTREEVQEIVRVCGAEAPSLIPRGSGTKMGTGRIPRRADLVVSTKNLNRVMDQDCENLTVTLEAGARFSDIQGRLKREGIGYFIPLDPPYTEAATLGGILATNSSGPKRLLYGTARDLLLGMKVVLADGSLISCGGKTVKNVSGYDMTKLFIGSFGTLGMIVEATLRLLPIPEREETMVGVFSKAEDAFEVVKELLKSQLIPSAIEMLNGRGAAQINPNHPASDGGCTLIVGIEGVKEAVERQAKEILEIVSRYHPVTTERLEGISQANLWTAVRDLSLSLRNRHPEAIFLKMNVPISRTSEAFAATEAIAARERLPCALWSHAGTGILQMGLLLGDLEGESDRAVTAIRQLTEKALEIGGNLIVEAAAPLIKKQVSVWGREGSDLPIFRQLKSQLDPLSLFNPGRFIGGI
jgi:FAD/FMN-containing dehydrogenase